MNTLTNPHSRRAARTLALFALIGIAAVSLAWLALNARITQAQRNAELALYRELDPDITTLPPTQPIELNGIAAQYQKSARTHFLRASTHKGYNGNITLLIAIAEDNHTLRGVRVLAHKETPGLGDKIDTRISPWIQDFAGKSLADTRFAVKKDGGDFDAFSGATITPRAVVNLTGAVLAAWQTQAENSQNPEK